MSEQYTNHLQAQPVAPQPLASEKSSGTKPLIQQDEAWPAKLIAGCGLLVAAISFLAILLHTERRIEKQIASATPVQRPVKTTRALSEEDRTEPEPSVPFTPGFPLTYTPVALAIRADNLNTQWVRLSGTGDFIDMESRIAGAGHAFLFHNLDQRKREIFYGAAYIQRGMRYLSSRPHQGRLLVTLRGQITQSVPGYQKPPGQFILNNCIIESITDTSLTPHLQLYPPPP